MSAGNLAAQNCAPNTEFAAQTFDVCMQLVHAPGLALAAGERERLLLLAREAVRMLGAPAPVEASAILRRPAVWRYA